MKMNWGTGIVLSFVLFVAFIMFFIIKVQSDSKYDNDLVVENYYTHDLKYNDEMERVQNSNELKEKPVIGIKENKIQVTFPAEFDSKQIAGTVQLYRASDKKLDFTLPIVLENSQMLVSDAKLIKGLWQVHIEWQYQGKKYLTNKELYLN